MYTASDNVNGNWTYGYDDFNRLSAASMPGAAYTYVYDRFGNRWQQNGPLSFLATFSGGSNRMDGYSYDAAGNVLNDNAGHSFTYDAENRIIQVGTDVSYMYDGDGHRIRKTVAGISTDYFYDLANHEIAETDSSGNWTRGEVFAGDRHIATYNNGTTYFAHSDWLGTERSRTGVIGTTCETIASLPFGDGVSSTGTCSPTPNFFTGKERDPESGLDYFGARFFSSNQGRWLSPDWSAGPEAVPYADLNDPQSLNLYGYVRNNPMSHADADGHCDCVGLALSVYDTLQTATNMFVEALIGQAHALATDPKAISVLTSQMAAGAMMPVGESGEIESIGESHGELAGSLENTIGLADRVSDIHGALDPIAQSRRTTAIGETARGQRIAATSSRTTLTPEQRAVLKPGESIAKGSSKMHAEAKIMKASKPGTLTKIVTTRTPCESCRAQAAAQKVKLIKSDPTQ